MVFLAQNPVSCPHLILGKPQLAMAVRPPDPHLARLAEGYGVCPATGHGNHVVALQPSDQLEHWHCPHLSPITNLCTH